ncbi:disease resistance protein rpm1 [Phtheirospermum japonicum]|uniref:Disease resistance protein rpm1 n=1 Tax=Phtheirospermum japonicum TaxID=374723 RepID=A0A830CD25_9LAMI|nr:disease resistance protein rpm1 [Phtheirospermum japonicum]
MAELALSATLVLLEIVPPFLDKLNLRDEVRNDIRSMKSWLTFMMAFMEESYGREGGQLQEDQVKKARDIAYKIEDVMEEFILHSPQYTFHNHDVTRKAHSWAHSIRHGFPLSGIREKIVSINRDIDDFKSQNKLERCSSQRPSSSSSRNRNGLRASPLLLDDEMVGYEEPKKEFSGRLVDREKKLVRLAVAGPTGSGKTTFVKNVYWKREICKKFDCQAWVYVSRNVDLEELFTSMLQQFCYSSHKPYPAHDGSNTLTKIHKFLSGKRYIVVLDDVSRKEDWDDITNALPDPLRGSRIIVTTSSTVVASSVCKSSNDHIYSLNGLEWLEGWTLFCRIAFPDINRECPSELKDCSVRIVKRCEGLPLAIVAIGKALEQKKSRVPNEWEKFHDSLLGSDIKTDPNLFVITNALLPSYMDLSSKLKSCLLYFSIFPEDHSVTRGRLIRLWVAEGFVMGTDDQTAEEVAEDYLNELINRNLVHVSKWDFDGRPKNCRVSNLVLKFIIGKCKDENFATISPTENANQSQRIRRLSISTCFPQYTNYGSVRSLFMLPMIWNLYVHDVLDQDTDLGCVRSMLQSRLRKTSSPNFEETLRALKLVRILDFQGAPLTEFPRDIARLSILKYLNLSDTQIKMIPGSIEKLSYLETLDLKQTDVTQLPKEISHLHKLRHLLAYKKNDRNFVWSAPVQGVDISPGICNLTNLQKLSVVKVDKTGQILNDLKKMTQLRKLGLTCLKPEHCIELYASIGSMKNLVTLSLCSTTKEVHLQLDVMSYLPGDTLQRLYLNGRLNEIPDSISSLYNLRRIGLKWSRMERSPLKALQRLQNLMEVQLVDCYIGGELIFEASCLKKLKILVIEELAQLHTIVIQDGAMPELKEISLRRCPKLMMCPLGIVNLTKVEELTLYDMANELIARLKQDGEDHWMVEHIRVVHSR